MSYVTQNIIVGNELSVLPGAKVITVNKGDLITQNDTTTVNLSIGQDNQVLFANSNTNSGLEWKEITPADIGLDIGNGLELDNGVLNVVGSDTIISDNISVRVNSSAVENQVLLSNGTVGTSAVYGALPLDNNNSVTGILSIDNGGTGVSSFSLGERIISTNVANDGLVSTSLDPSEVVTINDTQVLTNKTLVDPIIDSIINDNFGNEIIQLNPVADAVNHVSISNADTGNSPSINAEGNDVNINLNLNAKGTGNILLSNLQYPNTDGSAGQALVTNGSGILSFVDVPIPLTGEVLTSDDAFIAIPNVSIETFSGSIYLIEAKFLANNQSSFGVASYIITATYRNNNNGLLQIGYNEVFSPTSPDFEARINANGTILDFEVNGLNGQNVLWKLVATVIEVPGPDVPID